jgi:ribulose-5-phosphate 4-epimerase/fuculose-1-phosphate aldolase
MLEDNRLIPATQTAAFFDNRIAYDDSYTGLAATLSEGERLAGLMENKSVMFLKNHGVITVGNNMAEAYRLLYKLERACKTQVLAMSTGKPIHILEQAVIDKVRTPSVDDRHPRSERDRLYFEAMMRVIDRVNPGYAD